MRHFKFFSILFSVIFAGLTTSKSFGQCDPAFISSSPYAINASGNAIGAVCIPACTTSTCAAQCTVKVSKPAACSTAIFAADPWTVKGGIEKVSVTSTSTEFQIILRSVGSGSSKGFCKGRLIFEWRVGVDCPTGTTISLDFYKSFTPQLFGAPVIGPSCIEPGQPVTYSVNSKLACPADEIGIDDYVWNLGELVGPSGVGFTQTYAASDNSSITLAAPTTAFGGQKFSVSLGKCGNGITGSSPGNLFEIARAAGKPSMTLTSQFVNSYGPSCTTGLLCNYGAGGAIKYMVNNVTGAGNDDIKVSLLTNANSTYITASANRDFVITAAGGNSPANYQYVWTIPSWLELVSYTDAYGYSYIGGSMVTDPGNVSAVKVRAKDTPISSGTVVVSVNPLNGGCTNKSSTVEIRRGLTYCNKFNGITANPTGCVEPNTNVTLTIGNAPANTPITWNLPPGWSFVTTPDANATVVVVKATAGANPLEEYPSSGIENDYLWAKTTDYVTSPNAQVGCKVYYSGSSTVKVQSNKTDGGTTVNVTPFANTGTNPTRATVSFSPSLGSLGCGSTQLQTKFQFKGTVTPNGGSAITIPDWDCSSAIFLVANCGFNNGTDYLDFKPSTTYTGQIRAIVKTGTTPCAGVLSCFYADVTSSSSSWRLAVDGSTHLDPTWYGGDDPSEDIHIVPNPVENVSEIRLPEKGMGNVQVVNAAGQVVLELKSDKASFDVNTRQLPAGIYTVRFLGTKSFVKRFSVQ